MSFSFFILDLKDLASVFLGLLEGPGPVDGLIRPAGGGGLGTVLAWSGECSLIMATAMPFKEKRMWSPSMRHGIQRRCAVDSGQKKKRPRVPLRMLQSCKQLRRPLMMARRR
jgi:hypothetical protein